VGAGDAGGEGGMVSVQLEAVKREWRARGPVWARSRRSRVLSAGPAKIHLLWVQEIWEKKGDGQRTAGSRKTRVEGRVGASSRIRPARTHLCILASLSSIISCLAIQLARLPVSNSPELYRGGEASERAGG
jgi:hypothetical protein